MSPKPPSNSATPLTPLPPEPPPKKSWLEEAFSDDPIGDVLHTLWTLFDAPQATAARTEALESPNGHKATAGRAENGPTTIVVKNIFAKSRRKPSVAPAPGVAPATAETSEGGGE